MVHFQWLFECYIKRMAKYSGVSSFSDFTSKNKYHVPPSPFNAYKKKVKMSSEFNIPR